MPITSFSTDYTGRSYDILVFGGVDATNPATQVDSLTFGRPSQYVAGIQKLIQRYAISMLTNLGSQTNFPDFGTSLMPSLLSTSKVISQNTANHIFNFANIKVLSDFRDYQKDNPDLPLDEKIDTASLLSFSASGDTISFTIAVTSLAGSNVTFIIPLPKT